MVPMLTMGKVIYQKHESWTDWSMVLSSMENHVSKWFAHGKVRKKRCLIRVRLKSI